MNRIFVLLVACLSIAVSGCTSHNHKQYVTIKSPIKPIIIGLDTGDYDGPDLTLSITETIILDSNIVYTVKSLYKSKQVGFQLEVPKNASTAEGGNSMKLKSTGLASTDFLNLLSDLAKLKRDDYRQFVDSTAVSYVNLHVFAKNKLDKNHINESGFDEYKLFLENNDNKNDLELYINISERDKIIQIQQKESDTWPSVIKFLTEKPKVLAL